MIKNRMLCCADSALSNSLVWSRDRPEEEEMMVPLYTVKHMHRLIKKMFDRYKDRVLPGSAEGKTYFIHIENGCPCHPIYIVGTFVVLLLAGVEKILIEYAGSYHNSTGYLYDPTVTFFVEEMAKCFPNVKTIKSIAEHQKHDVAISFVNKHPEITHVVDIGGQIDSYERLMNYRKDVRVHLPAANFIWVDYSSLRNLQQDKKLDSWGEKCRYGIIDYECFCMNYEDALYDLDISPAHTYANCYTWEEFWVEFIEWRFQRNVRDVMNIFYFGDGEIPKVPDYDYKDRVRIVDRKELVVNQMYYDFMELLSATISEG